uniref:Aminotransferase-like plant mobile domain-containing protein n=1 Tax=Fagus sylvatica TaxID=28930 RepID=A0A2N9H6Y4_FAGSY
MVAHFSGEIVEEWEGHTCWDVVAILPSKGGPSVVGGARTPRGPEDDGSSSNFVLGSPEPHGDILGQPILNPWYRSSERYGLDSKFPERFRDLQIQRNEMLDVSLVFYFQCSRAVEWADWIDSELADRGFCDCLERAGVLRSILISRCSNMYRDTEALRQLVWRWCPSTHTFFFAHGELTVTLEDVENHWLLPILGDQGPADLILSPKELEIESALADYIGRKNIALGTQATRFNPWMEHFNRKTEPLIRRAAFVAYWLSKCVFGEHPAYSIKPLYFPLAVKIAAGVCFPLAPLLLGQIYTQLDLLYAEELAGASCHIVTTAFNSSIVHTFFWEHALEYIKKGRKPYEGRNKFASMPDGVVTNVGDFQGDVPTVYRWVDSKFYDHSLVPSLDSESKVCWRPYGVSHRGFMYESVMSGFSNIEAQDYSLIAGDTASLTYLSATNAGWLSVLSSDGLRFTVYSAHRVRKQFGFDQEVPTVMGVAVGEIPTINPFLRTTAFAYWSGVAPRVIVPSGDRSYTSPLPHPRLFVATNTMTTYADRQRLGYVVWHYEDSRWVIHGSPHPPLWLRDHPHVAASGKAPSSRGRRIAPAGTSAAKRKQPDRSKKGEAPNKDSPARASKRKKTSATKGSKEALKTSEEDQSWEEDFFPSSISECTIIYCCTCRLRASHREALFILKRDLSKELTHLVAFPIEIPDDLDSSSSSSDPSGAVEEDVERESVRAGIAETVSGADDFAADISSADISSIDTDAILSASSGEKDVESRVNPYLQKKLLKNMRLLESSLVLREVVETTPVAVTSSGGTVQGGPSGSSSHVDPSLLDSKSEAAPAAVGEVPGSEEAPTYISEPKAEHVEVAASEDPILGKSHSWHYDEVLAEAEDDVAGAQAADTGATTPVAAHGSPTETAGSGNEAVAEEERIHQSVAVEEFDRTSFSSRHAEHFWTFDDRKVDFEIFQSAARRDSVLERPCGKGYGRCSSYFRRGVHVGSSLLTLLCCVLAHMEHTRLEDITEVHILEWKAVVQEAIEGGFRFGFILDYLRRLAHGMFSRRVLAELREAEARVAALRDALNIVAPNPWDLASARRASAESDDGSALHDLLA